MKPKYSIGDIIDYDNGIVKTADKIISIENNFYHYLILTHGMLPSGYCLIEEYELCTKLNKETIWNNELNEIINSV